MIPLKLYDDIQSAYRIFYSEMAVVIYAYIVIIIAGIPVETDRRPFLVSHGDRVITSHECEILFFSAFSRRLEVGFTVTIGTRADHFAAAQKSVARPGRSRR